MISTIFEAFSSLTWNLYYTSTYHFSRITGFSNADTYLDLLNIYGAKGWNAYYKLTGSRMRLIFVPAFSQLATTKNTPCDTLKGEGATHLIAERAHMLFQKYSMPYIQINPTQNHLERGICQGMVQAFVDEYFTLRSHGLDFQSAAVEAAKEFQEGATLFACSLQYLCDCSEVIPEKFSEIFQKLPQTNFYQDESRFLLGHILLGTRDLTLQYHDWAKRGSFTLEDGVYDVVRGWKKVTEECLEGSNLHAMALLIEEGQFLVFDPNHGLLSFSNLESSFQFIRFGDEGLLVITSLKRHDY